VAFVFVNAPLELCFLSSKNLIYLPPSLPVMLEELAPTPRRMEHRGPRFREDGAIGWLQHRPMNGVITLCRQARERLQRRELQAVAQR
jgi:hypothetical protein